MTKRIREGYEFEMNQNSHLPAPGGMAYHRLIRLCYASLAFHNVVSEAKLRLSPIHPIKFQGKGKGETINPSNLIWHF